ncbi:thermophilic desulfurizing enzyme family protein [Podospora aff. communis PSN243]|uniref:Thermophilic desulfurizing enzyme family protein n=1 Tax=Podospora aff. communis PSN243 TaxID=3040156 RepID=A0AAV9GB98_9PEZI|nr:thermophilic desulfurizing enzyme family protein [Podospora aff. communis PSN243]
MRLLETTTLALKFFPGAIPEYAILSHRWEDEEVLYENIRNGITPQVEAMKGFSKVVGSCRLARREGYKYIWIDTCCIDKSSSAELSESINSMFNWYRKAAVCYAFLSDAADLAQFPRELIAPPEVIFFNASWISLGSRSELYETIGEVTRVPSMILRQELEEIGTYDQRLAQALNSCSVVQRFTWAARRRTTRPEDTAYCLLGIFGVNMPLLYGEGLRAFLRLQEEIIKTSNDQSILAVTRNGPEWPDKGNDSLLAQSPYLFAGLEDVRPARWAGNIVMTPTAKAIETTLLIANTSSIDP